MRKLTIGWLCLGALIALGDPTAAQQHPNVQRGFAPDKLYQFDIDQVNLLNGNLLLNLDLNGSFPLSSRLIFWKSGPPSMSIFWPLGVRIRTASPCPTSRKLT